MKYITKFFKNEKSKDNILVQKYPNGEKFICNKYNKSNVLHSIFTPLNDEQIIDLEKEVNSAQMAQYSFPDWYKDFFKTTNGLNMFFGSLVLYGEQTPIIEDKNHGKMRALIERNNPDWMAPFNLRTTNSIKFDIESKNRWLTIGSYHYDGTQIVIDFKKNSIVAMYALPVTISIKELKGLKESDYEKLIICEWEDFETFFESETQRLSEVIISRKENDTFNEWEKTLPKEHKNFEK